MARIKQYLSFDVPPEWQDDTPDASGVSPFDEWRNSVRFWAITLSAARLSQSVLDRPFPGVRILQGPLETHFLADRLEIYLNQRLLASLEIQYNDDEPPPTGWAFQGRSRQSIPQSR